MGKYTWKSSTSGTARRAAFDSNPKQSPDPDVILNGGVDIVVVSSERSFAGAAKGNAAAQRSLKRLRTA
jgi:hypothetical protein